MADVKIDRLTLKLSGLSDRDGRRLANLVADGLAGLEGQQLRRIDSLRVNVASGPEAASGTTPNVDRLADQIVSEILRQIQRST